MGSDELIQLFDSLMLLPSSYLIRKSSPISTNKSYLHFVHFILISVTNAHIGSVDDGCCLSPERQRPDATLKTKSNDVPCHEPR